MNHPVLTPRLPRPYTVVPRPLKQIQYPWKPREKSMTIVAGFVVNDGILLCGDTMYTGGMKIHQSKLVGATIADSTDKADHCSFVFGLAGNETNAQMAIEDCIEDLKECPIKQRTLRGVTKVFRKAILGIHSDYVDATKFGTEFSLIIGAWLPRGGGHQLFVSNSAGLVRRSDYDCIGAGSYLGHYVIRPVFNRQMHIKEVVLLAIQAVSAAKKYDPDCGGDTHFMTISPDGSLSGVVPYNISSSEAHIAAFEEKTRKFLFDVVHEQLDEAEFETRLGAFNYDVRGIRAFWTIRDIAQVIELLSRFKKEGQQDPESTTTDSSPQQPSPE
jgi:20S proteasome alpha/beta subunit